MRVSDIKAVKFDLPCEAKPGDTIKVNHVVTDADDLTHVVQESHLSQQVVDERVVFTHSILFKLDGVLQHIIGQESTVKWLESLAGQKATYN